MSSKKFVVDIDDTLLVADKTECDKCGRVVYKLREKKRSIIDIVNALYEKGHQVILWTGRNWDCYKFTKEQLAEAGIMYDELVMGKPQGIYVDLDAINTIEELKKQL